MLELFTLQGGSPKIQQCLKEEELCKTRLTCHFVLDVIYMSMEWWPTGTLEKLERVRSATSMVFLSSLQGRRYDVWRGWWPASVVLHSFSSDQVRLRVCSFLSCFGVHYESQSMCQLWQYIGNRPTAQNQVVKPWTRGTCRTNRSHHWRRSHSQSVATFALKNLVSCKRATLVRHVDCCHPHLAAVAMHFSVLSVNQRETIADRLCGAVGGIMAAPRWSQASMRCPRRGGDPPRRMSAAHDPSLVTAVALC